MVLDGPLAGKRVTVNPLVSCGTCRYCAEGRENICPDRQIISMPPREGAFAQQLVMPTSNLVEMPDTVAVEHAALAEPLAVCWHAVRLGREILHGDLSTARCLVQGGGAIGVGSALSLRAMGAKDVTIAETNPVRHSVLRGLGDFAVCDPSELETGFDIIVDCVGIVHTRPRGQWIGGTGRGDCACGFG